ncbi:restriction endonuclease subunit S [Leuconostoc mesenteroides]|uniref:restriction endonuclease subunit S n=1 Tax=Leuconostoc mesenteroides TaxID=1245 RepID=UPI00235F6841|nr:restriction endonuclease subunit S [Leuconostoc mesenteroides]
MSKKTPQIRFKSFTDDWEERKLNEVAIFYNGQRIPIDSSLRKQGEYPYYGATGIIDYVEDYIFDGEFVLLAEDGANITMRNSPIAYLTQGKFWLNNHAHIMAMKDGSNNFLVQLLEKQNYEKYNSGTAQPKLNSQVVKSLNFLFPTKEEQKKIGSFFKQIDDTIVLHQRKLDLLKEQKKGFLQKMFPKNGAKIPELRFEGFSDDWEERKLSSGLREYTDRVIVEDDKEYYQISVRNNFGGITLRGSKMGNKIGRKRQAKINLTKYPQTLVFTRQTVEQGGIGWVDKYCDGAIVTENMPTISLDTSVFSKYFLTNLFQTRIFYKNAILDNIEGGSAQIAIHESKFLSSTLLFPNLDEQEKIGQFFKQLDDTIDLHQRKLDLLKEQKKGFLQKMFVS